MRVEVDSLVVVLCLIFLLVERRPEITMPGERPRWRWGFEDLLMPLSAGFAGYFVASLLPADVWINLGLTVVLTAAAGALFWLAKSRAAFGLAAEAVLGLAAVPATIAIYRRSEGTDLHKMIAAMTIAGALLKLAKSAKEIEQLLAARRTAQAAKDSGNDAGAAVAATGPLPPKRETTSRIQDWITLQALTLYPYLPLVLWAYPHWNPRDSWGLHRFWLQLPSVFHVASPGLMAAFASWLLYRLFLGPRFILRAKLTLAPRTSTAR